MPATYVHLRFVLNHVLCGRKRIDPLDDFRRIPTMPCARESLLYGIGTGAGVGGIRFLSTRREYSRLMFWCFT
jgi:hypothetical protein